MSEDRLIIPKRTLAQRLASGRRAVEVARLLEAERVSKQYGRDMHSQRGSSALRRSF